MVPKRKTMAPNEAALAEIKAKKKLKASNKSPAELIDEDSDEAELVFEEKTTTPVKKITKKNAPRHNGFQYEQEEKESTAHAAVASPLVNRPKVGTMIRKKYEEGW
jgi:hypothetical protein